MVAFAMPSRALSVVALALVAREASAQVDTLGFPTAPWSGSGPVRVTSPWSPAGRAWAVGAGVRYEAGALARYVDQGGVVEREALVGHALDLGLSGVFGLHDRVALGLTAPVRLAGQGTEAGPAVGDPGLWAPISLLRSDRGALAVVPRALFPLGSVPRHTGMGGPRVGAEVAGGLRAGPLALSGTVGAEGVPDGGVAGGVLGLGGAAASLSAGPWSVSLEGRARGRLGVASPPRGLGTEAVLTVGRSIGRVRSVAGGGGAPLGVEPGVAPGVAFVQAVWTSPSSAPDVVLEPALTVVDPAGRAVRGATVWVDDRSVAETDADGMVRPPRGALTIRAPGLQDVEVPRDRGDGPVVMPWRPVPLQVRVSDLRGAPVDARVTVEPGPGAPLDAPLDVTRGDGGWSVPLLPGAWVLHVRADGFGAQRRSVSVEPRREQPVATEVVLLPDAGGGRLDLAVVDPERQPVEGARVLLDGVPIGTTASGGDVVVDGLAGVQGVVRVTSESFREGEAVEVSLAERAEVSLAYQPGTVRVTALGPDGAVTDGLIQVLGPAVLPPLPLGADGERLVVLEPGDWTIVLSSAALGVQERQIEIREGQTPPIQAEFVLQRAASGGDLVVRVLEPDGTPLPGADVTLDGEPLGRTASGGTVRIAGVPQGTHALAVSHPGIEGVDRTVEVDTDLVEAVVAVRWRADAVLVAATDTVYDPVDALVQFECLACEGADALLPGALGPRGLRYFDGLQAGTWDLVLSSPDHGIQSRRVSVGGSELATAVVVFRGEARGNGSLEILVVDPEGQPSGAPVWLDGTPIGRADGGRLIVEGLGAGRRAVAACEGALGRTESTVSVGSERASVTVRCPWATGATRFTLTAGGVPVDDALLRVSGPTEVRPAAVDAGGRRVFALAPGPWSVLAASSSHGVMESDFEVRADGLTEVALAFGDAPAGSFVLRVTDRSGRPVPDAEVLRGRTSLGSTNGAGVLLMDAPTGALTVRGPQHAPAEVRVPAGASELVVELVPVRVPVDVKVSGPDGSAVRATISAHGPASVAPTDVDGQGVLELAPGSWRLVARAEGLGARQVELTVVAGEGRPSVGFALVPAKVVRQDTALVVQDIRFDLDADTLTPAYQSVLGEVAAMCLADDSVVRLEAQGHTDATGDPQYNVELSERRARVVRDALIAFGVPPDRVVARGYGPTRPVADNGTSAGRASNRRVEFRVVEER